MDSLHDSIAAANSAASANGNTVPPFLSKTYDMVDDASTNSIVSWSDGNNSFVVWNVPEFGRDLLPKYFKHNNFSSFVRQLNTYGFRKVDPDRWEFANEGFLRGQKHLLKSISRRKPAHAQSNQQPQVQNSPVGACVEVGKFGLEEEVERLKRDKNVLMQELVRLRQQQQATDSQLQTVGQRVQVMEQRQQQMMSFLAKAMQSPGFLNQLVQQQTDSSRRISSGNKKRRLPRQGEGDMPEPGTVSPNGQIIKYQPSINEAAKAMLHQILKMNTSPRLDPSMNNHSAFLIDGIPSSNALGNKTACSRISGVMLSEVPLASKQPYVAVDSGFPHSHPSTANCAKTGCSKADRKEAEFQNALQMECVPGNSDGFTKAGLVGPENGSMEYIDSISAAFDGTVPGETDEFSGDHDTGMMLDDAPKLPAINDTFWEQFLAASPLTGDPDEINSSSLDSGVTTEQDLPTGKENVWDRVKHMDNLAEQMGLLASEGTNG